MLNLSLLLKIKYSKYMQNKENKKDIKVSSGSYKLSLLIMAVIRGLYYSYIITSQFYLIARFNSINTFNKLDIAVELNIVVELVAELVDIIIVVEYHIGSTAFYITNYY